MDGIRNLITKVANAIGRVTKLSAGGAAVELHTQDVASNLTPEQAEAIKSAIQNLSNEKQDATNLASHYFLKFVGATIYGSQYKFLDNLEKGPLNPNQAISFYNEFLSKAPKGNEYAFDRWINYLSENFLVQFNTNSKSYKITQAGRNFITQARNANLSSNSWPN